MATLHPTDENYIYHWIEPFLGDCMSVKDIRPLTVEKWHREARKAGASGGLARFKQRISSQRWLSRKPCAMVWRFLILLT